MAGPKQAGRQQEGREAAGGSRRHAGGMQEAGPEAGLEAGPEAARKRQDASKKQRVNQKRD